MDTILLLAFWLTDAFARARSQALADPASLAGMPGDASHISAVAAAAARPATARRRLAPAPGDRQSGVCERARVTRQAPKCLHAPNVSLGEVLRLIPEAAADSYLRRSRFAPSDADRRAGARAIWH